MVQQHPSMDMDDWVQVGEFQKDGEGTAGPGSQQQQAAQVTQLQQQAATPAATPAPVAAPTKPLQKPDDPLYMVRLSYAIVG